MNMYTINFTTFHHQLIPVVVVLVKNGMFLSSCSVVSATSMFF